MTTTSLQGLAVRRGDTRGLTDLGWLHSRHSFSFGSYFDPHAMRLRSLRVLNDDVVAPGGGFGEHGHADMEIITWVLEGSLAHRDSTGRRETLGPGHAQVMSAGTGIRHSEMNGSASEPVHFLQIWITPDRKGHTPGHASRSFEDRLGSPRWQAIASGDGRDGSLTIHQDATVSVARLPGGETLAFGVSTGRTGYVHVARGAVRIGTLRLEAGDAVSLEDERQVEFVAETDAELVGFDLA